MFQMCSEEWPRQGKEEDDDSSSTDDVPATLQLFFEFWPHDHSLSDTWQVLRDDDCYIILFQYDANFYASDESDTSGGENNHGANGSTGDHSMEPSEEDNGSDSSTADVVLTKIFFILEHLEKRVSWNRRGRVNLDAALFCYAAFLLGYEGSGLTVDKAPEFDAHVPNYEMFPAIAQAAHVHQLSTSMIHFILWYLVGFEKHQLDRVKEASSGENVPRAFRVSRSLTLHEFVAGTPYEKLTESSDEVFIFVSHRWMSPHHPDPDRSQTKLIQRIGQRVQDWLDVLLQPHRTRDIIARDPAVLSVLLGRDGPATLSREEENGIGGDDSTDSALSKILLSDELHFAIQLFVRGQQQVRIWYDYYSIPQGQDAASRALRATCLTEIAGICESMIFLGLISKDYFTRGWCAYELIQHTGAAPSSMGTKLLTGETDDGIGIEEAIADAFFFQRYTEFRSRGIHGRFCGLLETQQQEVTAELLNKMGVQCTNGADLEFLSRALAEQIKTRPKEDLLLWVHPLISAIGRFLDESISPAPRRSRRRQSKDSQKRVIPNVLVRECFRWRTELEERGQEHTPEVLAAKVTFRWRYPNNCLDHLLETRVNFENIPDYQQQLNQALFLLNDLCRTLQNFSLRDSWEDLCRSRVVHPSRLALLEALQDSPGYDIQIAFS